VLERGLPALADRLVAELQRSGVAKIREKCLVAT
jgi:hypothetical protein